MKKLFFSFVLFLVSSLFILNGCYTVFKVQERESTYESVIPDSNQVIIQVDNYLYNDFRFQSGWYFGYRYPYLYLNPYWHSPWDNLWYRFYWDGYRFGYWYDLYNYPYFYRYPYYWKQHNLWITRQLPNSNNWFIRSRTRDNDGERGIKRPDIQKPRDQNIPPRNINERKRDVRTRDKNVRDDQNRGKVRDAGERTRDFRPVEKKPPQTVKPRENSSSGRQRTQQVVPTKKDSNSNKQRKEPTRITPQNSPTGEKSLKENPTKSKTTRDRGRG